MTEEQNLVYTRGMLLQAEIRMNAMKAANQVLTMGNPRYDESDFMKLIDDCGVHHNALLSNILGR